MATWPDLTDYHEALQSPQRSLADPELQKAQIDKDRFGMPKPATGGNAVVYKATESGNVWAVRCFLRPISDHAERYAAISKHLGKNRGAHSTRFFYLGGHRATYRTRARFANVLHRGARQARDRHEQRHESKRQQDEEREQDLQPNAELGHQAARARFLHRRCSLPARL